MMKLVIAAVVAASAVGVANAQQSPVPTAPVPSTTGVATPGLAEVMTAIPSDTTTVTSFYKQNLYDRSDSKIGEISDVLVGKDGKIDGFIVSVGGFLGIGEKNVAVPFNAVQSSQRNGSWWLTMNATKDQLMKAPGYKYDRNKATWVPA